MPPVTRLLTGNKRRRPIRQVQAQYRHSDSLNAMQILMRYCLQYQMMSATLHEQSIHQECLLLAEEIDLANSAQEAEEFMAEIELLQAIHRLLPVNEQVFLTALNTHLSTLD